MKLKSLCIVVAIVLTALGLNAKSVTFLQDGRTFSGSLIDMSSRTGMVDYWGGTKIHRNQIWMINFVNNKWNFPDERRQLSNRADTLILTNGQVMHVRIVDFSSRRKVFEFQNGGEVHVGSVKRLYFCCVPLPQAYAQTKSRKSQTDRNRYAATFVVQGRMIESPLSYINSRKTAFMNGLQINTKDIWLINLEDPQWDYARERRQLDRNLDTIFLKNGEVLYDTVVDFNKSRRTFRFENIDPIHESRVSRIYFCCGDIPEAFRNRSGDRYDRRNRRRRR